jgi:hypothetical protein
MPDALASSFVISEESKKNIIETTKIMGTGSTLVLQWMADDSTLLGVVSEEPLRNMVKKKFWKKR